MTIEERIKNNIKDAETKKIWDDIITSFEKGGPDRVRKILDMKAEEFYCNYDAALEKLKRLL